jgi:drug/metabolite transporter (DMT)-like permease
MLARAAPLLFVLLWSSSFISTKAGLRHLSPLLFVAIRLLVCALVLGVLALLLRRPCRPLAGWRWLHCAVAGALMNGVGLMAPHAGLVIAPAAQIALVQSLTPLLTAICGVALLRERLGAGQWLGLVLGMAGVGLVVGQAALQSATELDGLLLALLGVVGLVAGTLYFAKFCRGVPQLAGSFVQFTSAAALAMLCTWSLETPRADWTTVTVAALAWNALVVSLGGMGLYFVMLVHGTAARATANFYLVPGTVALLAWMLLGEPLTLVAAAGIILASAGCWLVNAGPGATAGIDG